MPTICLNMIVKNESHVIVPTLENLCSHIRFDYWVICDTGSTDNTRDMIREFFAKKSIQGELVEHEWVNFGHNRTKALECAFNKTDYVFIFDADDKICGSLNFDFLEDPTQASVDAYTFTIGTSFVYKRALLMNNRLKWQYRGVLHEYLAPLEPDRRMNDAHVPGNYHIESCRTGSRNLNPRKYVDDATVLKNAYEVEKDRDPDLAMRYVFYCAQSYKDAGPECTDDAIAWYKRCLDLPTWAQEKYYSCLSLGFLSNQKRQPDAGLKYFLRTVEYDAERIEGIVQAMEQMQPTGNHMYINALYHRFKGYIRDPKDKLFLFKHMYHDELEYNNTLSAFYAHDLPSGYECCKRIILNRVLSPIRLHQTVQNLKFYLPCAAQDTDAEVLRLFYAVDKLIAESNNIVSDNACSVWNALFERCRPALTAPPPPALISELSSQKQNPDANCRVLLTFTTCKRLDLFKQTVHSILNHWEDIAAVDAWFCVDDNSSEADRAEMRVLFPWIQYCMKPADQCGHASSMNVIWDQLNETQPKYWIHMEDDFLFHTKMRYVETAIAALESSDCVQANVKQVLFNRNYGELIEHCNVGGHAACGSLSHIVLHRHVINADVPYANCHYWPHYSFRPSLIDVAAIMELGKFKTDDSKSTFFEMEYAHKWNRRGFTSAFFNKITNRHIGRLTKDRHLNNTTPNAYQLNDQPQFDQGTATNPATNPAPLSLKIVNLERRHDRKMRITNTLRACGMRDHEMEFIKATDGSALRPTTELARLFKGNDFGNRRGVIGCALTHYGLWKRLLKDAACEFYIIMEDDFTCRPDFKSRLESLLQSHAFAQHDVIMLGYHMFQRDRDQVKHVYNSDAPVISVRPLDKNLYIGGTFGYSINKRGAARLVDYIAKNGIRHGIDYLIKIIPGLKSTECQPQLVFSEWNEGGAPIDSDIQNIGDSLDFSQVVPGPIRIKMMCNWCDSRQLCKEWCNMCEDPVAMRWKNLELVWDDAENNADYFVIINSPPPGARYDPSRTIVFQMEPWVHDASKGWGVKTWGAWAEPSPTKFMAVRGRKTPGCHNNPAWQLELTLQQLKTMVMDKDEHDNKGTPMSCVCSSKYFDEGHIARIDFLKFLETKNVKMDIFSQDNPFGFKNYAGALHYVDKSVGIAPYKYYFMVENNYETDYITEKLWEPILCECLTFYYGCPNVSDYIDPRAYVQLDMADFEGSYRTIKTAIEEDWWSHRIDIIRQEKQKILNELAFFPTVERIIMS